MGFNVVNEQMLSSDMTTALHIKGLKEGQPVYVAGTSAPGDGGGGMFQFSATRLSDGDLALIEGGYLHRSMPAYSDVDGSALTGPDGARLSLRADITYLSRGSAIIAHRGGGMLVSPDNGMSGFRYALKNGVKAVEVDVWMTDDFQLVCMHDETIDRTTDGTGNTVDLTASTLESVRLDSDIVVSPAWRQEKIPLFLDVLQEFGGKVLLVAEAKNDSALLPMIDMVEEFGIDPRSVVIQSPTQSLLAQAVARGFPGMMLQEDLSTLDWGDVADDGIQYVASTWSNFNSTYVGLATAAGIKCIGYTVDRRVDRDAVFALGLTAIFSDDPVYLLTSEAITTYDRFPSRMFMPGMIPHTAANRGAFTANGGWEPVSDTSSSFKNSLMGSLCPTPASWVMDFLMRMDAVSADDRWASIFICAGDDSKYIDGLPYAVNGYHCLFRRNGTMGIYPFTANVGVGTPTTVAGTNLTLGADNAMRITVTPTTITLANLTQGHSVQLASTLARGGYLHFGSNNCRVTYKSIRIT